MPDQIDLIWAQSAGTPALPIPEARDKAKTGYFKAAVTEGPPPLDNPESRTILFRLVKQANAYMRERKDFLEAQGYKRLRYGLSYDLIILEGPEGDRVALGIDKARR